MHNMDYDLFQRKNPHCTYCLKSIDKDDNGHSPKCEYVLKPVYGYGDEWYVRGKGFNNVFGPFRTEKIAKHVHELWTRMLS